MSLPKNALYQNAIETSYARNYQSNIAPQNGMEYGLGETIIINVPSGRNLVMSGADSPLKIAVIVKGGVASSNYVRLDKAGIHSLIQRVRVFHGSTLLSDIDNYNNLVGMMMSLQQSGDSGHGKQSILAGIDENFSVDTTIETANGLSTGERLNGLTALGIATDSVKRTYTVPIMNFLSYSDKYIPLFAMTGAPLRIEIQLVSNYLQGICTTTVLDATTPLIVKDVEYICNFMEIADAGMNVIQNSLGGGPLKWVVQDYRNYQNSSAIAPNTQLSVPIPSKFNSLRSLFMSFRNKASGAITYFPLSTSHFDLASYTLRLGSKTVPTKAPTTVTEYFGEVLRAIGSVSDLNHEPNITLEAYDVIEPTANAETATAYHSTAYPPCFYVGCDLESYSSSGMESVYQGYNTSTEDDFFTPVFGANAPSDTIRIDTYALFDQVVVIEGGFCSIQF